MDVLLFGEQNDGMEKEFLVSCQAGNDENESVLYFCKDKQVWRQMQIVWTNPDHVFYLYFVIKSLWNFSSLSQTASILSSGGKKVVLKW